MFAYTILSFEYIHQPTIGGGGVPMGIRPSFSFGFENNCIRLHFICRSLCTLYIIVLFVQPLECPLIRYFSEILRDRMKIGTKIFEKTPFPLLKILVQPDKGTHATGHVLFLRKLESSFDFSNSSFFLACNKVKHILFRHKFSIGAWMYIIFNTHT